MARRLLRTIVVSVTCTESWTLVWLPPEREDEPGARAGLRTRRGSTQNRSTSSHSTHTDATPPAPPGGDTAASRTGGAPTGE